jgi:DNA recombination protein RmuC
MSLEIFLVLAAGLVAGGAIAWFAAAARSRVREAELRMRSEQLTSDLSQRAMALDGLRAAQTVQTEREAALNRQNSFLEADKAGLDATNKHLLDTNQQVKEALDRALAAHDEIRGQNSALQAQLAQLGAKLDSERLNSQEKLALLTSARTELSNQFETLANKILEEKSKRFAEQNQASLGTLITPLKEKFGEFQQKVESLEKDGVAGRTELKVQIEQLRSLNERLSQDATNLVSALKGSSKTQGDWGEFVLESILESSGLRKGYEYRVQESFTQDDRSRARLDVILDLPGARHLVLDSKVSLNHYNDYCNSEDTALREASLGHHLASVRNHIRDLSKRNYQTLYGLNSLDFVVMFIPIEPAFMLAIARDSKLWQEAWEKNILLVSPSTLLFVLRTVSQLWRQEQQTKNVQDIVRRGGELYDKLAAFAKDLVDVGKSIDNARSSYDEAYKKLAQGKGNVIRQAEMLKGLGIKSTKSMPLALVEQAMDDRSGEDQLLELAAAANPEEETSRQPS